MKMNSPIGLPDRLDVAHERGYSAGAAGTLARVRAFLDARKLVRTAELERVTARLKFLESRPMSRHQRLALRELLGRAANAEKHGDYLLAAQAYISLGHELEADGDRGSATNTYHNALIAAQQSVHRHTPFSRYASCGGRKSYARRSLALDVTGLCTASTVEDADGK